MTDQKVKLALRIIGEQFGDIVQDVASVLTEGDKCTLPHVFRTVNANIAARAGANAGMGMLPPLKASKRVNAVDGATVRMALNILHQHNCLCIDLPRPPETVSDNPSEKPVVQTGFLYSLNVANVLHRLSFARLLSIIRQKFGDLATHVAEAVMLHGKMRLDQIQTQVLYERQQMAAGKEAPPTAQEVRAAFETLVSNRFIVTVPLIERAVRSEAPKVTFSDVVDGRSGGVKRAFEFLGDSAAGEAGGATSGSKRVKGSAGTAKPAGTGAAAPAGNRRGAVLKAPLLEADDGMPVELRMMLGGLPAAPAAVGAGKTGATGTEVSASLGANMAHRSTKDMEEAEWGEDGDGAVGGRGGRAAGGRGGRGAGGRGAGGRTALGAGRGGRGGAVKVEGPAGSAVKAEPGTSSQNSAEGAAAEQGSVASSSGGGRESVALWTIGWDQYVREVRHAACVQVVSLLHEALAGNVVRVMLALSMSTEKGANQAKSGEVFVADIHAQLEREHQRSAATASNSGGAAKGVVRGRTVGAGAAAGTAGSGGEGAAAPKRLDLTGLKKLLEYLRLSESGAVIKVVGSEAELGGPSYMVNIDGLLALLQRRTVYSVASERFGFVSARIVELLQRHQYLEQQQVCDMALLPARETRERLYKLFLDGWVNYIDLSKRSDFNPSTSFYFWFLDLPQLKATIRDHTYQAMYNLCLRRAFESEKGREVLEREDCIDNEADRQRHAKLMNRLNKLDLALLQAHSTAMLMGQQ